MLTRELRVPVRAITMRTRLCCRCHVAWLPERPSPSKKLIWERPAGEGARKALVAEILGATALTP